MSETDTNGPNTSVSFPDLRFDADVWREQSVALASLGITVRGFALDRDQLGVFASVMDAHDRLADKLSEQCAKNGANAEQLSVWLAESSGEYERTDDEAGRGIGRTGRQIDGGRG